MAFSLCDLNTEKMSESFLKEKVSSSNDFKTKRKCLINELMGFFVNMVLN